MVAINAKSDKSASCPKIGQLSVLKRFEYLEIATKNLFYPMFITCRARNILRISRSKAVRAFLNHVIPKQDHYNQQNGNGNNNSNEGFPRGTLLLEKE